MIALGRRQRRQAETYRSYDSNSKHDFPLPFQLIDRLRAPSAERRSDPCERGAIVTP